MFLEKFPYRVKFYTKESLRNKSRRSKYHPKAHTAAEVRLIQNMRRQNPESGLLVFWVKLVSVDIAAQLPYIETHRESSDEPPNSKYVPNPYEQMLYPGQET